MANTVLVVDDSEFNRMMLKNLLQPDYAVLEAENGRVALNLLEKNKDDLVAILLDLLMPVMNGIDFLKVAKDKKYMDLFPVLIVTSEQDVDLVSECFDYGVSDFIRKPINNDFVKKRVDRLVDLYYERNHLKTQTTQQDSTLQAQYRLLKEQAKKLREGNENIIQVLGTIVEYRNLEGGNHIKRIGTFSKILAAQLMKDYPEYGLTPAKIRVLEASSALHDVGKILIPDHILLKPGKLTNEEFAIMKSHSLRGFEIIKQLSGSWDSEYVKCGMEIARWHHEKFDGRGYPDGLIGDKIPISAQIVSLADCYDALINDRVYRQAYSLDVAFSMIRNGECGVFSPKLLAAFSKSRKFLEDYAQKLQDDVEEYKELAEEEAEYMDEDLNVLDDIDD